jgi:Flagellar basal body-associated protein
MAKEAKSEVVAPPRKSKKWLIIIVILLVLSLILGGFALLIMKNAASDGEGYEDEVVTEKADNQKKNRKGAIPIYVALDVFTVNLAPEDDEQFLQLILSVEVADAETGDRIKAFTPKIRNNVMMLLSSKKASELLTKEGKENLAKEIRDQMNEVLAPGAKGGDAPIREVLFTSFIIQ